MPDYELLDDHFNVASRLKLHWIDLLWYHAHNHAEPMEFETKS